MWMVEQQNPSSTQHFYPPPIQSVNHGQSSSRDCWKKVKWPLIAVAVCGVVAGTAYGVVKHCEEHGCSGGGGSGSKSGSSSSSSSSS
jgi:hypothetical protein